MVLSLGVVVTSNYIKFCSLIVSIFFPHVPLQTDEASIDDLMELVQEIVAFHMKV